MICMIRTIANHMNRNTRINASHANHMMRMTRINVSLDSHDSQYYELCESLFRMIRRYMQIMRIKIFAQQNNRSESHANHMIRSTLILTI